MAGETFHLAKEKPLLLVPFQAVFIYYLKAIICFTSFATCALSTMAAYLSTLSHFISTRDLQCASQSCCAAQQGGATALCERKQSTSLPHGVGLAHSSRLTLQARRLNIRYKPQAPRATEDGNAAQGSSEAAPQVRVLLTKEISVCLRK